MNQGGGYETVSGIIGRDPQGGLHELDEAGKRKAQAEGVAYELDHTRKIVLARIMGEIASAHPKTSFSEAKLERLARADSRYEAHIKRTAEAMAEKEDATSTYFRVKAALEWDEHVLYTMNALARLER